MSIDLRARCYRDGGTAREHPLSASRRGGELVEVDHAEPCQRVHSWRQLERAPDRRADLAGRDAEPATLKFTVWAGSTLIST
jgi:hypothetical protein